MTNIDWSLAPEGATHHIAALEMLSLSEFVVAGVKGSMYGYDSIDTGGWSSDIEGDNRYTITPRPTKQLYTTQMQEAGELPSVGMECKYKLKGGVNWFNCKIIAFNESEHLNRKYVWLENLTAGSIPLINLHTVLFKTINPSVNLINGRSYQFTLMGFDALGFYREDRKSFFSSGNKVCGETEASNIILLTTGSK